MEDKLIKKAPEIVSEIVYRIHLGIIVNRFVVHLRVAIDKVDISVVILYQVNRKIVLEDDKQKNKILFCIIQIIVSYIH